MTLPTSDAVTVGYLLRDIARTPGLPLNLCEAASHWASVVARTDSMRSDQLQEIIWLFRTVSSNRCLDASDRTDAEFWAERLSGLTDTNVTG